MADSLRILHLTDTHLRGDDSLHYGFLDTEAALRRVLERAAVLDAIDVVVVSGDLSDDGSERSYRTLRELVEPWAAERGAAVVLAMGNHDQREGFEEVIGERYGVHVVRGVRFIHLDSAVPGCGHGELDDAALAALRDELATPAANGSVVVVHHPPVPATTALLSHLQLRDPQRLLSVCAAGDVRLILSGHYHYSVTTRAAGIPVLVAPAIADATDPIAPAGHERATVGAGFAVVDLPVDPSIGGPRASFVAVPGPDDGHELFDLGPDTVAEITSSFAPEAKETR